MLVACLEAETRSQRDDGMAIGSTTPSVGARQTLVCTIALSQPAGENRA
jgi:hypothetical protein